MSFTAYQLVQKINTEYPNNGFTYDEVVNPDSDVQRGFIDYINNALLEMNKYALLDDMYEFPTIKGQSIYELPLNCEFGNVREVVREYGTHTSIRLRYASDGAKLYGNTFYNAYSNMIGIYPIPMRDGEKIMVFFKRTPRMVQTIDDPIEIADKWINLLVYSVVIAMASSGSNPDIEVANNYTIKYNDLLTKAVQQGYASTPFYPQTKDNKKPPISVFRRGWRA